MAKTPFWLHFMSYHVALNAMFHSEVLVICYAAMLHFNLQGWETVWFNDPWGYFMWFKFGISRKIWILPDCLVSQYILFTSWQPSSVLRYKRMLIANNSAKICTMKMFYESQWTVQWPQHVLIFGPRYGGWGHNRAATKFSFEHVTTKTCAYSGLFGFFRFFLSQNMYPSTLLNFLNTMGNSFLKKNYLLSKSSIFF